MPNKRKRERSSDRIKRKIRGLELQLEEKSKHHNRLIIYSDSDSENESNSENEGNDITKDRGLSRQRYGKDTPSTSQAAAPATTQDSLDATDPDLDSEILALLGDAPKSDTKFGKPTHKDLASRWQEILEKGLPKEIKEKLMTEYLIPENCDLLVAPSLNPEVKVALADNMVKRDVSLVAKQKQLSVAIAALNQAIELIISKENHTKILKPISDACRLLCDSHCTDTKTRRGFIISSINPELKDTLTEAKRDSLLFGENISEKLKSAKSIKKSAADLKQARQNNFIKHNKSFNSRLNWKTMPRKITPKTDWSQTASRNQRPQTRSQQRGPRETSERSSAAAATSNRRR